MAKVITLPLDSETASAYEQATPEVREKIRLLASLWVKEFALSPRPLKEIMDEIAERAQKRGLTPDILDALLDAE